MACYLSNDAAQWGFWEDFPSPAASGNALSLCRLFEVRLPGRP